MRYNPALDYLVVACKRFEKGNFEEAGRLFAAAQSDPSIGDAIRILEANNQAAFRKQHPRLAASIEAKFAKTVEAKAATRVKANEDTEEEEVVEVEEIEADEEGVDDLLKRIAEEEGEAEEDEVEDVEAEAEDDAEVEEISDEEVEAIVARMRKAKRVSAAKANAKSRNGAKTSAFAKVIRGMKG